MRPKPMVEVGSKPMLWHPYVSSRVRAVWWDDQHLGIEWPLPVSAISGRDREASLWPPAR